MSAPTSSQGKYPCPNFLITHNSPNLESNIGHHNTSPSWCIAFVRYAEPAANYTSEINKINPNDPMIIENDCISVSINNSKSSYLKQCTLRLKAGEVYYPNAVHPGDWVVVWMHDSQIEIDAIIKKIKKTGGSSKAAADFHSGLKFVGRVSGISSVDSILDNGIRTIVQTVTCTSFLELRSTIYFTDQARYVLVPPALATAVSDPNQASIVDQVTSANLYTQYKNKYPSLFQAYEEMLGPRAMQGLMAAPDRVIGLMLRVTLGIDETIGNFRDKIDGIRGSYNDAIIVPTPIAEMLGRPNAKKLWQFYKVYLGVQTYSPTGKPWESFCPRTSSSIEDIFYFSSETDGSVDFHAPLWNNRPIWSILNDYLNPVVNEMYTCLRISPSKTGEGIICPSIVVREYPFSTGLYKTLVNPDVFAKEMDSILSKKFNSSTTSLQGPIDPINAPKTYYGELPRWVIDESMISSIQTSLNEEERVNFIQVWGQAVNSQSTGMPELNTRAEQLRLPNWYINQQDVQRHGLRADIAESMFDSIIDGAKGTRVGIWAAKRADWMFNGHLKLSGNIYLKGVVEPICEGDNIQVRGILYHIEAVSHQGSISSNGMKRFETVISASRGILANSLSNFRAIPKYAYTKGEFAGAEDRPGVTDIQTTFSHGNRNDYGEKK